jgi:hypothetical protein
MPGRRDVCFETALARVSGEIIRLDPEMLQVFFGSYDALKSESNLLRISLISRTGPSTSSISLIVR